MPSGSVNAEKTECPYGHQYDIKNTYITKTNNRKCRKCHTQRVNASYKTDTNTLKTRVYGRKAEFRRRVNNLKSICSNCPEIAPECLDFHHKDSTQKLQSVSWMISNGKSWDVIEQEILKCIVLCSNCHRKLEAINRKEKRYGICNLS